MKPVLFFKGLSWLVVLNLLVKPVWIFFIDREVQNQIGHEAYGHYFSLFSLCYVLLFIADAGLTNMMNQRLAKTMQVNTLQCLRLKLLLSLVYLVVVFFIATITGIREWSLLIYITGIQLLTSLFIFLRGLITANQYFSADAWLSIIDKTLVIVFCAGFIYSPAVFGDISLVLFLQIQLLSSCAAVIFALWFILRKQLFICQENDKPLTLFRAMTPFAIIILLMSVHYRLDGFLLERLHTNGDYEAGLYASAFRLLDAGNMVGYLAAGFLVPFAARNQTNKTLLENLVSSITYFLLLFGIAAACFSMLFPGWIQQLLYHSNSGYHSKIIQLCIAVLPAYMMIHIYGSLLTATSHLRVFIIILAVCVFINIGLNLWLIPGNGAAGSAISALISQYLCAIACYSTVAKILHLSFRTRSNWMLISTAFLLSLFLYFGKLFQVNVWLILVIAALMLLLILLLLIGYKKIIPLH